MKSQLIHADELTRRRFIARTASAFLGVGLLPEVWSTEHAAAKTDDLQRPATAKNVIYLYMAGGQSQLDTWDPKDITKVSGATKPIPTSADGLRISQYLSRTAKQMHHGTVIRSLTSTQGAHEQGVYYMHTSYKLVGTIRHPSMGAWLSFLQNGGNPTLPKSVFIGEASQHPGGGFFPSVHTPLFVNNPANGIKNVNLPAGLSDERFAARLSMSAKLDADFITGFHQPEVKAYGDMYDQAVTMMKSADLKAFDLTQESTVTRKTYGDDAFGQGCLLARRLVEHGVRFVEVQLGNWDTHASNWVGTPKLCEILDQALAALLADLHQRGLLRDTLVVLATEFGRTPDINVNEGRDHYPQAFSGALWGGGVKQGYIYGQTDEEGRAIKEKKITIPDFNATIATALGLPLKQIIHSPDNRPFTVADKGKPAMDVFA
jgi:hypothetical protein